MTYRAIIFDLDGTAIPNHPDGMPSKVVIDAVNQAKPQLKLCAATGRAYRNSKQILHALELDSPCVVSGGTRIVSPIDGKILWEVDMGKDDIDAILRVCSPFPYEIIWRDELVGEGDRASKRFAENDVNVVYVMGCGEADANEMLTKLSAVPNITATPVRSWTERGVDIHITSSVATKEHAVEALIEMLGVTKAEAIGVGDGDNDLHLFNSVGHRIAMGNATENLKAIADEVCGEVDANGLAHVIKRYSN